MADEVLHALCALAAFFLPLGFAWLVVWRGTRRHASRRRRGERPMR
ncbi:hypothetical protein [Variovorax sp. JS1663]|nr:hypothetical protein [Variovorax sp. JS1663]